MQLWWWIEPLFMTGLFMLLAAFIVMLLAWDSNNDVWSWIVGILILPFVVSVVALITFGVLWVFWYIWHPYF